MFLLTLMIGLVTPAQAVEPSNDCNITPELFVSIYSNETLSNVWTDVAEQTASEQGVTTESVLQEMETWEYDASLPDCTVSTLEETCDAGAPQDMVDFCDWWWFGPSHAEICADLKLRHKVLSDMANELALLIAQMDNDDAKKALTMQVMGMAEALNSIEKEWAKEGCAGSIN